MKIESTHSDIEEVKSSIYEDRTSSSGRSKKLARASPIVTRVASFCRYRVKNMQTLLQAFMRMTVIRMCRENWSLQCDGVIWARH